MAKQPSERRLRSPRVSLSTYRRKRDFGVTPEPKGKGQRSRDGRSYLIQKHAATRLHYDFRLEHKGVLLSWAVPEGPPLVPGERRLAVHVEDHPIEYGTFEGVIPKGQYGGGTVMLWDRGHWKPTGDVSKALRDGKLSFELQGERLRGAWTLAQMSGKAGEGGKNWLLIKRSDKASMPRFDRERSVTTRRTMEEIARDADRTWSSTQGEVKSKAKPRARSSNVAARQGAKKRRMPTSLKPQLATLVDTAPRGDEWLHEFKYDGYRIVAFRDGRSVRLLSRTGRDWTENFPSVARAVARLGVRQAVIDGEVVVVVDGQRTDFQALQNSLEGGKNAQHTYFVFDLIYLDGFDLRDCPLTERKELLATFVNESDGVVRYSRHITGQGAAFFGQSCRHALEGIVSKRADAPYVQARTRTWLKVKCIRRQEFVVAGWSDPEGSRSYLGSLLLGAHNEQGKLVYCGRVGTGFNEASLRSLHRRLERLSAMRSPFVETLPRSETRDVHWVKPSVVVEVAYSEWTRGGHLRHPSFQGIRQDKLAREVKLERPIATGEAVPPRSEPKAVGKPELHVGAPRLRLTHAERVLYPEDGITKRELVDYYVAVQEWFLPHVVGRPLTLLRCPAGYTRECFYQKHVTDTLPRSVKPVSVDKDDGAELYVSIEDLEGLLALVQLSVLEFHPWGSRSDSLDQPDRIVFDLDPDSAVPWKLVVESAHAMREFLKRNGLESFPRTTGGKGLHVVVPLTPAANWSTVKTFAKQICTTMARSVPQLYVLQAKKSLRKGRIFLDYLRNDRGATAIASYSGRARQGAPVATPVTWAEVTTKLDPHSFNVRTLTRRLKSLREDPWSGFFDARQTLPKRA